MKIQSLGYVANEVLMDIGKPQGANLEQIIHFGTKIYRDMNIIGIMPSTKTVRLRVNPFTHSCELPKDYIEYNRISMVCRSNCGYETLINLVYNDTIALKGEDTRLQCTPQQMNTIINEMCGCHDDIHRHQQNPCTQGQQNTSWAQWQNETYNTAQQWGGNGWGGCNCSGECSCNSDCGCGGSRPNGGILTFPNNSPQAGENCCPQWGGWNTWQWGGWGYGGWNYDVPNFGIGPGWYPGGFRINTQLRTIQFDSCVKCDKLIMEYQSTGFDVDGDVWIPQDTISAMVAGIHWLRNLHREGSQQERYLYRKEAKEFQQQYMALREDVVHRLNSMTLEDYLDVIRRYTFQGVHT